MIASSRLHHKTALVTGASSGIGRAVALDLARHGVRVVLTARREDRLRDVARAITSLGGEAHLITADLTNESQVVATVAAAATSFDGLDILINSAGVALQSPLASGQADDWRTMWEINVHALAIASREALSHFPPSGGHIVNLCSMSGHRVPGKGGFYAATKFAVRALSEGLRQELRAAGNPTRVSQISPGFVNTELLDTYFQSSPSGPYNPAAYPMLEPEDIAATILHVLLAPSHVDITDILLRPRDQAS